jgi:LysM repeat protein
MCHGYSRGPKLKAILSILFVCSFFFYSCNGSRSITILPAPTYSRGLSPDITVAQTQTPTIILSPTNKDSFATSIPNPSPTSFIYTIQKDDTFSSIAYRHGVKLNDLISANPDIDPNFLSIGISITIPITGSNATTLLNPTPIPLNLQSPNCYQTYDGGLWCLALVENTQSFDVENVSGQFFLLSTNSDESISRFGITPLNLLQAGKSIPLTAYFPPPNPKDFQAQVELGTVLPIQPESQRYIKTILEDTEIHIAESGLQARVSGNLTIPGEEVAGLIWVVAFAYDKDGALIGFRKWESVESLTAKETMFFEINLYSLGPPIDHVEILTEARP